jgi:hypothetical protein
MRLLAKVTIPLESRDEASKSGALPLKMQAAMKTLRPESAYFVEEGGKCECFFVFNLDFATLLQPLFPDLDASFHVTPVMNAAEFQQALGDAPAKPVVGESDLLTDLSPEAKTTPGRNEPGNGERRVRATPLGDEPAKER